jgi:hypothetical protein
MLTVDCMHLRSPFKPQFLPSEIIPLRLETVVHKAVSARTEHIKLNKTYN